MYVTKKISFCLKKRGGGWFIEPQIGDLSWKRFSSSRIREKGCFSKRDTGTWVYGLVLSGGTGYSTENTHFIW